MLVEAHAKCPPSIMDVAGFLVAASSNAFFGCGPWFESDGGPRWYGEWYDRPLGEPAGPASVLSKVWRRRFASGTSVVVDFNHMNASITWGDGTVMATTGGEH